MGWGDLETINNVRIAQSDLHGIGLFCSVPISKGDILCVLDGQIIEHDNNISLLEAYEWNALGNERILLRSLTTSYGFINHSLKANLSVQIPELSLIAVNDIDEGSELTLNYLENGFPCNYLKTQTCAYLR